MSLSWNVAFSFSMILGGVAAVAVALAGCSSWQQPKSQVWLRETGETLQPWKSLNEASELHLAYAWASVASYQDSDDPKRTPLKTTEVCPEPHQFLLDRKWVLWDTLPLLKQKENTEYADAFAIMRDAHLRAEVWSNEDTKEVVVAFAGTAASAWPDWEANGRWLVLWMYSPPNEPHDQYWAVSNAFIPAFTKEFLRRKSQPGWEWLSEAKVISTGHSLGGGLSQRFAYALKHESGVQTVRTVYAFDTSPVSGKRTVENFQDNAKGLTINRVYNRGEVLASVRSILRYGDLRDPTTSEQGQIWHDIRYIDNWTWRSVLPSGSVKAHGMYHLACFMENCLVDPSAKECGAPPHSGQKSIQNS